MELGGKSPALVLPGADVKIAANNVSYPSTMELKVDHFRRFPQLWADLYVD
jgi:hypothetical protein